MNFSLPIGIFVITLGFKIFQNLRNKTKDSISFELESPKISFFFLRFFVFLGTLFGVFWILKKGPAEFNAFWFFFSLFWFYLLSQKKIVLEKGIGISDIFKSNIYLVTFKEIISFEKSAKNHMIINYIRYDKEFQLKLVSNPDCLDKLEKILNKKMRNAKK